MTTTQHARYDLHTHSTVSDGTTTPAELAAEAAELGLSGFALTDHDTIEGWGEAREAAAQHGIEFLPGIELTTNISTRSLHLLAYGPRAEESKLHDRLAELRTSRKLRAREMVSRLRRDFVLDWDSVIELVDSGQVQSLGRPHLADALVAAGFFTNRSEAFERVLSPRGPYYVPSLYLDTIDAIELVRDAGGVAVLAHPAAFRMSRPLDPAVVERLFDAGLFGIELDHPENRPDWIGSLRAVSERLGLVITGASDYHGEGKPNRMGERTSSAQVFEAIRSQVAVPR